MFSRFPWAGAERDQLCDRGYATRSIVRRNAVPQPRFAIPETHSFTVRQPATGLATIQVKELPLHCGEGTCISQTFATIFARNGSTLHTKLHWATPTLGCRLKKKMLFLLFAILVVVLALAICSYIQVRATPSERARTFSGDVLIPQPVGSVNHAITIRGAPHDVWPWLAQMGSGRAGWYAYDFIDNGGHPSAERILPEYQNIEVGTVFPALPGATEVFVVAQCEPDHSLVLAWRLPSGKYQTTWAFVLEQPQPRQTRLIVRGRVAPGYRPYGLPQWLALPTGALAHFIMQRKQLLGIAHRAETYDRH